MQQSLRWNTADIETGPTMRGTLLNDSYLHAQLGRTDGADIAARPGADYDKIIRHGLRFPR